MGIGGSFLVLLSSRQSPSSTTSNAAAVQLTRAVSEDYHGKEFVHTWKWKIAISAVRHEWFTGYIFVR